jgi:hypothetical protein
MSSMQQKQHCHGSIFLEKRGYVTTAYNFTDQELVWLYNQKHG